jgi:iron complex outermembrane receptor protein
MKVLQTQLLIAIITTFMNILYAQELRGIVISDANLPIENVSVSILNRLTIKTNKEGVFVLPDSFDLPLEIILKHPDYVLKSVLFIQNNQQFILKDSIPSESLQTILVNAQNDKKGSLLIPSPTIGIGAINQQSPIDVVAAINQIPGIYIQSGAINTNRIVIRGVGSRTLYGTNKIRAYFNEIPITSGVGETTIDSYDPEDLQSIEIIKGPKATQYGTNLGGTLLLYSKKPEKEGATLKNSTTLGSFGLYKNAVSFDYSVAKLALHFTYDHLETNGFRDNSSYNRNAIYLNSSYQFNDQTEISLLLNYIDYTAQIPSSISKTAFEEDPSQAAFTWGQAKGFEANAQNLTGLSLKHSFSKDFKNTTSIFYSYSDHYEPRPFNILDEFTNGFGFRTLFNKTFIFSNREAEWTFGSELFKDEYHWKTIQNLYQDNNGNGSLEGTLLSNNEEYRQQLNLFTSVTLPIFKKLSLQFGINFNKTKYDFQDEFFIGENNRSAARDFNAILAPNLNVRYDFNPNQTIFGNVSYGFNYPSLEETLTPDGAINPEISPEKGFNYEIGSESFYFNRKWHVFASLYIMNIKDLLVAQRIGEDQFIGRNAGQTVHKGLEISTDYNWVLNESFAISPYVNASFNWHRFEDFVSDNSHFSGNKLTGVPDMTIASGIAFLLKNIAIHSNHLYVGEMPMNDANSLYSEAYNILNMKLTYTPQLFKAFEIKLNVGINNVSDSKYASSILINATGFNNSEPRYYYPGNPRNYYGGVSVRYNL